MKRFFRVIKWLFLGIIGLIAAFLIYCLVPPKQLDVSPEQYSTYWKKGMSMTEVEQAAQQVLSQMTLEEKIDQLKGQTSLLALIKGGVRWLVFGMPRSIAYSGGNDRLHIPPLATADGPRGLNLGKSTCYPVTSMRGATWDPVLEYKVGEAMGVESRAWGVNYNLGCCINLLRHPAWGRSQEAYSEDPWLTGQMGKAFVQGVQSQNVMCCVKHFALNSVENTRNTINVSVDERTLHEVYLPHFKQCVDGGAASIMSAYNQVNGDYCGHNEILLDSILRKQWGFKGFVSSDWIFGIYDGAKAANAGMDIEMPIGTYYSKLPELIQKGTVSIQTIDTMVLRVLRMKLWYITRPDPMLYPKELIASDAYRLLAREAAEKGTVLLKNEQQILPLNLQQIKSIAVLGPLADVPNIGDRSSSDVKAPYVITPLEGIKRLVGSQIQVLYDNGKDPQKAAEIAKKADVVILTVGYQYSDEGESLEINRQPTTDIKWGTGGDRPSLLLKSEEEQLIKTVSAANPKTIVNIIGGSAVVMENWRNEVPSILFSFYGGMEGGTALANILFGTVNPSGRLPFSIAKKESDYPWFYRFTDTITYGYYHGYTLLDKKLVEPAFAFGYGLGYSAVSYKNLQVADAQRSPTDTLQISVDLHNTGRFPTEEVVQLYIGFSKSTINRPKKLLRGFTKVALAPDQQTTVTLRVPVQDMGWYNPMTKRFEIEKMEHEVYVGSSSRAQDLSVSVFRVE